MKIAISTDHAGFNYKEQIKKALSEQGHEVCDFGPDSDVSCDYPDFIRPAAEAVADGSCECGVIMGGSGNGEAIVANKVKGVRFAVCWDVKSAELAKQHNNANMISFGERMITLAGAFEIIDAWMGAKFEGGRHQKRIDKIEEPKAH